MNDLYKPVDVKRLMELAGVKEADADVPTDYKSLASPEVQANYNKGGQRPDPTDPIIANRMGANVPQADLAKAAQTRPAGPTATVPTATAAAAPTAAISVPDAQDFGAEPKKNEPVVTTTPVPAPTPVTATPLAARPAYAGSAGSQAIQKLNPAIKDVNKIQAGQKITLPSGETYTVQRGDTLDRIAARARAEDDRREQVPVSPEVQAQLSQPVATNPAQSRLSPMVQNAMPGATLRQQAGLPAMIPTTPSSSVATNPTPAAPAAQTPPSRIQQNAAALRARRPDLNNTIRETSADLGRMQSLAGIRKN
jgi:LysM repeat protein